MLANCLTVVTLTLAVLLTVLFALQTIRMAAWMGAVPFLFAYIFFFWIVWAILNTLVMAVVNGRAKR